MKKRNSSKAEPVCALEGIEEGIEGNLANKNEVSLCTAYCVM